MCRIFPKHLEAFHRPLQVFAVLFDLRQLQKGVELELFVTTPGSETFGDAGC
jgi:hypothetical protein